MTIVDALTQRTLSQSPLSESRNVGQATYKQGRARLSGCSLDICSSEIIKLAQAKQLQNA